MFDSHIHLHRYPLFEWKEKIKKWQEQGVKGVIAVSDDLSSSYQTLELQHYFPNFVYPAVGFHPELPFPTERDKEEWKSLVKHEKERIVAIGEIGLPHYEFSHLAITMDEAVEQLKEYVSIATMYDLPVVLHAVHDKATVALSILKKENVKRVHFHWLKANVRTISDIVAGHYFVSVTPEICYRDRDKRLVEQIPLSQLLIETDGPWPFQGEFQQKETTPLLLDRVIDEIATMKQVKKEDVRSRLYQNTITCYSLSK